MIDNNNILIISPTYTIAPTAIRPKNSARAVVQVLICSLIPYSSLISHPAFTRSAQERHPSRDHPTFPLNQQLAKVLPKNRRNIRKAPKKNIFCFFIKFIRD